MDDTKYDFRKRKEEIDEYFAFLEALLNNEDLSLTYKSLTGISGKFCLSIQIQKILTANTFLLLYNLVESTIRNSIVEIYTKIKNDKVSYQDLSNEMKEVWLHKVNKDLTIYGQNNNTTKDKLTIAINEIINKEIIELTKEDIYISGNIDAQKIRELAEKNGFQQVQENGSGKHLEEIKNKRNHLAHGNQTFNDIGKESTYNDLNDRKKDVFSYLENVIQNIETFIEKQEYKKVSNKEV